MILSFAMVIVVLRDADAFLARLATPHAPKYEIGIFCPMLCLVSVQEILLVLLGGQALQMIRDFFLFFSFPGAQGKHPRWYLYPKTFVRNVLPESS